MASSNQQLISNTTSCSRIRPREKIINSATASYVRRWLHAIWKTFPVFITTCWASNTRQPVMLCKDWQCFCPSPLQYTIYYEKSSVFSPCSYTSPWCISDWSGETKKVNLHKTLDQLWHAFCLSNRDELAVIDCVLQRRRAKALPVFAKHNWLSCVACSAGRNENRECFSNCVKSTAYIRCSCTVYDFLLSVGFVNKKWCCWLVADTMMRLWHSNINVCCLAIK